MVTASAAGGITGMAAGVSADLAVQTTEILSGMSDGYDPERTKNSALLGGAVGAGLGAASQTPLVQKAGAKFHAWDAVLKEKTGNIGEGFQASMADNRGFADFDALSGKKTSGGVYGESGSNSIDPNKIRYSQSSVNGSNEIIQSMKKIGWKGDPIDVVEMPDGIYTTIDNTRVVSAREAGINVQANVHGYNDPLPSNYIKRFTTGKGVPETWGKAIELRIGKQKASFRNENPYGKFDMERIN